MAAGAFFMQRNYCIIVAEYKLGGEHMITPQGNKKGFTLVEVIVVLVILAILAAILIPSMVGWIDRSDAGVCELYRGQTAHSFTAAYTKDVGEKTKLTIKQMTAEAVKNLGFNFAVAGSDDTPVITGLCPRGGTVTVKYESDGHISLSCSVHGGADASYSTAAEIGDGIKTAVTGNSAFSGMPATNFYKGVVTKTSAPYYDKLLNALPSSLKSALAGKSWTVVASAGMSSFKLIVSDTDITGLAAGSKVSVTVYDSKTGKTAAKTSYKGTATDTSGKAEPVLTDYYF